MFDQFDPERICLGCMAALQTGGPCPRCGFNAAGHEAPPHQLKPGSILNGKYLIGRALGEGGFGITYIGFDLNLELRVAIKEYYPNGLVTRQVSVAMSVTPFTAQGEQYGKGLNRFVQEAKSLAKFHDLTGIVSVKDFFRENATAYIVMEYIEGETFRQYIARKGGRLPMEEALSLLRPVMESLALVHGAGIIHRDISPDNIMLTKRGAKLIDFGAARTYVDEENRSRTVTLKSGYAPYEQYQTRGEQGPWTDVYALCATVYKCVTGTTPPEATDRMAEDTLRPLSALDIAVDPRQEAVLLKGLSVKARDRYQDIPQLNAALFQTLPPPRPVPQPEPIPPVPMPGPEPEPDLQSDLTPEPDPEEDQSRQKKWVRIIAAAVLVVPLAIALLGSLFTRCAAEQGGPGVEKRGNTSVNISNGGYAAQQGEWIYFTEGAGGLYKEKLDGTGRELLTDSDDIESINVLGDWVYYMQSSRIARIKTDGSREEYPFDEESQLELQNFYVVDDVFYTAYAAIVSEAQGCIQRRTLNGSPQNLYTGGLYCFIVAVEDGWIYFRNADGNLRNESLMKMTLDGKEITPLAEARRAQVIEDTIYYIGESNQALYRINAEGLDKTLILEEVSSFQIHDDWIYYSDYRGYLFKSRLDNNDRTQLTQHMAYASCIVGDWVFYRYERNLSYEVYRVKTDGTQDSYRD